MIKEFKGDLLKGSCNIICHQVNLQGIMGGGLARQIATLYPQVEEEYRRYLKNYGKDNVLYNIVNVYEKFEDKKICMFRIVNCFSQDENFNTNYEQLKHILKELKKQLKNEYKPYFINNCVLKIGIPKNYGCGIANGDWNIVKKIWCDAFEKEQNIELQIWEL